MSNGRLLIVASLDPVLAEAFVSALAGAPARYFELAHPEGALRIEAAAGDDVFGDGLVGLLADAAGLIVVTQHGDAASVEELRRLIARLPQDVSLPTGHALHREPGRMEFKISCANCGQKLWVADAHEGRQGRCPGCKQTFMIPSQPRHLAAVLQLPTDAPVRILVRGDTTSAVALVNELAERLAARDEAVSARQKNTTMRIVIDPDLLR